MSKSVLVIDTPANCFECPCFMEMGWRCNCRLDIDEEVHDGRPDWCPLHAKVGTIPIEWIEKWAQKRARIIAGLKYGEPLFADMPFDIYEKYTANPVIAMIEDWEAENETD